MKRRILNLLIAIDQLIWVIITLGHGNPDETISAACYRMEQAGKPAGKLFRPLVDSLFFFDKQHCKQAWEAEIAKAQLHKSYSSL